VRSRRVDGLDPLASPAVSVVRDRDGRRTTARPFSERLAGELDPIAAAGWLREEPRGVALSGAWLGAATILSSHPLVSLGPEDDPFLALDSLPFELELDGDSRALTVGGGWFGWLGFGLSGAVERVPPAPPRRMALPRFDLAFHDHLVLRKADGSWWFEALWSDARTELLSARLACWRSRLAGGAPAVRGFRAEPLTPVGAGLRGHHAAVSETIERIAAGEHSQANLCLRLEAGFEGDLLDLWTTAAAAGRPAYGAYVAPNCAGHAVASLSPELFLKRTGRRVITRPIKGTAPIASDPALLSTSEKDRAENVMIVDLMRNDLGRVCRYGSITVEELCALRAAPGVWQLESSVHGELRSDVTDSQLLRATFPPGSVTGAPKVQALRTVHELEGSARESYCGAVGLCSPLAGLELNVAIRTLELARGRLWLGVGGGIVSDSSPEAEVAEALAKARGVADAAGLALAGEPVATSPAPALIPFNRAERPDPGQGVFETIRVSAGQAAHLDDHVVRLAASCAELGLSLPAEARARIASAAAELSARTPRVSDGALRVTVSRSGIRLATRPLPQAAPTELVPVTVPGGLGAHKWADRRLVDTYSAPGQTPLICDSDASVLEAGYAAVLVVIAQRIIAPRIDGRLLPSLSRERLLRAAGRAGWETCLRDISIDELASADAIVLTSSLRGPHPARLTGQPSPPQAIQICEALTRACAADQEGS
jgi:para-aminobenzoate synthetase/4-amino-4-deoxychorismate lyase